MAERKRNAWERATPWLVLVCGVLATIGVAVFVYWTSREQARVRFDAAVEDAQLTIENRMQIYVALLRGAAGVFSANESLRQEQFHTYVRRLRIPRNYPGIQGVGFSRRILAEEKETIIAEARSRGLTNFALWPATNGECHAILYLEPRDRRNRAAFGFNMASEPTRRDAMQKACDSGDAAASGRVTLVQEIDGKAQAGFLIYAPIYRGGAVPRTVKERREKLLGFAYAPFRADDVFAGIFATHAERTVDFYAYDGAVEDGILMHATSGGNETATVQSRAVSLDIAGRPWTFAFYSTPEFESTSLRILPPVAAASGVVVTALLYTAVLAQRRAHRQAEVGHIEAARRVALRADVAAAFTRTELPPHELLQSCVEAVVRYLPAAFARIWTLEPGADALQLQASAGIYTHLDGPHSRIPVGKFKIGMIAAQGEPHLTNDVPNDPRISDPEWARRERLQAFAGYPLRVEKRVIGVVALFSRERLSADTLESLAGVADVIAQGVARRRAADALKDAQHKLRAHAADLETRVNERTQTLEEMIKSLEGFSYTVAHDLRAPLRTIHSFGSLLVEEHSTQLPAVAQDYVRRMTTAAGKMDDLIQDLLTYNKLSHEELPMERVSLKTTTTDVLSDMEEVIGRTGAEITITDPMPDVLGSPVLIKQVLTNLLSNALKFMQPGTASRVRISAERRDAMVRLNVADNGIGVEQAQLRKIFGVFERLHGAAQYPGTGIGLAIVEKAITRMGGAVGVESTPGVGSTFWFELRAA